MRPEERIKKHKQTIEAIREDIEWLKSSGFTITSKTSDGSNAQLIEREEQNIAMYEGFIAKLEEKTA